MNTGLCSCPRPPRLVPPDAQAGRSRDLGSVLSSHARTAWSQDPSPAILPFFPPATSCDRHATLTLERSFEWSEQCCERLFVIIREEGGDGQHAMLIKSNNCCFFSFLPKSHMDDSPCSSPLLPDSATCKHLFPTGWAGLFFFFSFLFHCGKMNLFSVTPDIWPLHWSRGHCGKPQLNLKFSLLGTVPVLWMAPSLVARRLLFSPGVPFSLSAIYSKQLVLPWSLSVGLTLKINWMQKMTPVPHPHGALKVAHLHIILLSKRGLRGRGGKAHKLQRS